MLVACHKISPGFACCQMARESGEGLGAAGQEIKSKFINKFITKQKHDLNDYVAVSKIPFAQVAPSRYVKHVCIYVTT